MEQRWNKTKIRNDFSKPALDCNIYRENLFGKLAVRILIVLKMLKYYVTGTFFF